MLQNKAKQTQNLLICKGCKAKTNPIYGEPVESNSTRRSDSEGGQSKRRYKTLAEFIKISED